MNTQVNLKEKNMKYPLRMLILIGFLFICVFYSTNSSFADENSGAALIYNGKFADSASAKALSKLAGEFGLKTVWFNHPRTLKTLKLLKKVKIVIIGGTVDDINPFAKSFTADIVQALKQFINEGGAYLGICGGGYLASSGWEEKDGFMKAMGLVPFASDSYLTDPKAQIIQIKWNNETRSVYYQFGPKFLLPENASENVIARYDDNSVAAFSSTTGMGKIVLAGPHPEADETWIDDSVKNASEWTSTYDMALSMMQEALKAPETEGRELPSLQLDIKANGSDGPITVTQNNPVVIDISLKPGDGNGQPADWWIAVKTPFSQPDEWWSYVYPNWVQEIRMVAQGGIVPFESFEVLNGPLQPGKYTFYFALDDPDGQLKGPLWGIDSVEVIVQ